MRKEGKENDLPISSISCAAAAAWPGILQVVDGQTFQLVSIYSREARLLCTAAAEPAESYASSLVLRWRSGIYNIHIHTGRSAVDGGPLDVCRKGSIDARVYDSPQAP